MNHQALRLLAGVCLLACVACDPGSQPTAMAQLKDAVVSGPLAIKALSNRADLISGGDALVEVTLPAGRSADGLKADVDGRDISGDILLRGNGRVMGLVTGLKNGANTLTVKLGDGSSTSVAITNYPNGGPIFSGPQIQPWPCLAGATDAQCNRPVTYSYMYKSTNGFSAYDPANPPATVPTTTTDQGKTVPYIVRVETGSQDRGQYQIAVLFDPAKDWAPWAPQEGWNGKTYVTGGSGCGTHRGETTAPDVMDDNALSRGFMVWSTALDHNTQNCNLVVQAESLMMAKERIVENYGPIRYTISSGCSGGAIYQQQAANSYPGIFDGILPNCSFPDSWSTAIEVVDCRLLVDYFDAPSKWGTGVVWTEAQEAAVSGHPGVNICQSWINVYGFDATANPHVDNRVLGLQSCNVPAAVENDPTTGYDETINPKGVRCDLSTYFANELGLRPDGTANRPADNVGVMYGLNTLKQGLISTDQFVDLNVKLGGRDNDYNPSPDRVSADLPALPVAYQGGLINEGTNMGSVAIIDLRGHDIAEIHHDYRSYVMRARLDQALGHHDNQVIWTGPAPLVGDAMFAKNALTVMDQWLAAVEADTSDLTREQKIVKDKPAAAHDMCTDGVGDEIPNQTICEVLMPYYQEPRMVAGEPFTGDVVKCRLKPLLESDLSPVQLTDAQWAQMHAVYPDGVCDYGVLGIEQQATIPWMSYADGPGGKALGDAPGAKITPISTASAAAPSRFGGALPLGLLLGLFAAAARRQRRK